MPGGRLTKDQGKTVARIRRASQDDSAGAGPPGYETIGVAGRKVVRRVQRVQRSSQAWTSSSQLTLERVSAPCAARWAWRWRGEPCRSSSSPGPLGTRHSPPGLSHQSPLLCLGFHAGEIQTGNFGEPFLVFDSRENKMPSSRPALLAMSNDLLTASSSPRSATPSRKLRVLTLGPSAPVVWRSSVFVFIFMDVLSSAAAMPCVHLRTAWKLSRPSQSVTMGLVWRILKGCQ